VAIATALVYDAINGAAATIPAGQRAAGYTTGSSGIAWTAASWAAHPGAVRIDQDASARDHTADVLDVESQAATPAECPAWIKAARASFSDSTRPGQREPAIYCNQSTLTPVVNALIAGGVTDAPIWLARPGIPQVTAHDQVASASGSFPIIGVQYHWGSSYDISVFSLPWLTAVSGSPAQPVLSAGASGPAVVTAQQRLNVWGASPALTADGSFGPATETAVRSFQAAHGLTADGVIGAATWAALGKNPVPPAPDSWAYPAPAGVTGVVDRSITLSWDAVVPPAGQAAPASYTVKLYKGTAVSRTLTVAGLSVVAAGLSAGPHSALVWADGAPAAGPHASFAFTV
jgi:putative peptidoglycan binding protein